MKNLRIWTNKRVCVATSGGMDSTALLHYLKSQEKEVGYTLLAVHCEHGIRGKKSVADMRFVEKLCKDLGVELFIFRENCKAKAKREKISLETAAREFRYASFQSLLDEGKADCIATAHHAKDEAETVLFRLARGTSLSGAAGMHAEREDIIRPFLQWSKEDVEKYVKENKLAYRKDKTNKDKRYTRNALRLKVLPALENTVDGAIENIARFASQAAEDDRYLYRQSEKLIQRREDKILVAFSDETSIFYRAALTAMKEMGIEKDYTKTHLEGVFRLQQSERGSLIHLPLGVVAKKELDGIAFFKQSQTPNLEVAEEKAFTLNGFDGGVYEVKLSKDELLQGNVGKTLRIDLDSLPSDAFFRFRRDGDEIEKFGGGTKTIKKFFNEKKVPVEMRGALPLIASEKGKAVYVVCGYEIAENVKVQENTKNTLYIALFKK